MAHGRHRLNRPHTSKIDEYAAGIRSGQLLRRSTVFNQALDPKWRARHLARRSETGVAA